VEAVTKELHVDVEALEVVVEEEAEEKEVVVEKEEAVVVEAESLYVIPTISYTTDSWAVGPSLYIDEHGQQQTGHS